jgi:phage baseplate assembly protein W
VADSISRQTGAGDFLGRGWAFPLAVAPDDQVMMVADAEDVRQSIRLILETDPGERVMRPDFGAGLRQMLFEPINTNTLAVIQHHVVDALVKWEPRIDVRDVIVSAIDASSGRLAIKIDYVIRSTNTFYNLVYPFYLQEAR